jgi:hypothetical protein
MVDALLGIVDLVRSQPPTFAEEDSRAPSVSADDAPKYDVRMVSRDGLGEFTGPSRSQSGDLGVARIFSGDHVAGATVREGLGSFAF